MRHSSPCLRLWRLVPVWLSLVLAACSVAPDSHWPDTAALRDNQEGCRLFQELMAAEIERAGTRDAEAVAVAGFPFLRTNRFLASFAASDLDAAATQEWVDQMQTLANETMSLEFHNLDRVSRQRLDSIALGAFESTAIDTITACANRAAQDLMGSRQALSLLRTATVVPDHYDDAQRVVGAYPLTALPVAMGYSQWRRSNLGSFGRPPENLPVNGTRIAYFPEFGQRALSAADVRAILDLSNSNSLSIPAPSAADTDLLFQAFAPVWIVDVNGPDDRIGRVSWNNTGTLSVNTAEPVVYRKLTWTRFNGDVLLQLNYLAWFPARTKTGTFDLLGGSLDAVIWRVTLAPDGQPLIYDTIHACGCYHLFFPVPPLVPSPGPPPHDIRERAESPMPGPTLEAGQRVAIWLSGVSHYVQTLTLTSDQSELEDPKETYALMPADGLRQLARPDGQTQSIYGPDGLVDGTERLERFLLWPMGIASPGAMRQWGTHATAFVGRRHFDNAYLFENAFHMPGNGRR